MADRPPVFIVGSPRSGTSFLRNVLNRHPSLAMCGETRFFADVYRRRWLFGNLANPKNRRRLVEQYLSPARARRIGVDPQGLKEKLLRDATSYPAMLTGILEYHAESQGKKRFGEKTPHHAFHAKTLCQWYPGAAIIHLVRDPRDVVASLQRMPWAPNSIVSNASMWLLFDRAARRLQNDAGYLLVRYEDLVNQPEQELTRICAHMEEEYDPSMLRTAGPLAGPYSWPRRAAGPLTRERVDKWREELTAQDVALVEWIDGRDMERYGYRRSTGSISIATIARGLVIAALDWVRRQAARIPYWWYSLVQPTKLSAQEYWKYRGAWDAVFPGFPPSNKRKDRARMTPCARLETGSGTLTGNHRARRPPRQLLIILDAMEWALVSEWASAGKLPTFRRLLEQGARAELASTAAQLPDTVWAAIYSGTNPAKFAKYFYVQYDPATGDLRILNDDAIGATPFWDHLSAAGRRVCVLDVPKFPVSRQINGFHVTNWGSHATSAKCASEPPGLLDEINKRFGKHPVGECDATDENPRSWRRLRRHLLAGIEMHGEMCRFLMAREDWDVFFAGFSETHCVGHHFWRFYDATNAGYDPADKEGFRDTIQTAYQAVDRQVGELMNLAGPETRCLIFSGHGMGPMNHASWNLQEMLDRLGFGSTADNDGAGEDAGARVNPWRLLQMMLPGRFQYAVRARLPQRLRDELIFRWYAGSRHWAGCRAIAVPNNESVGAIRILVQGRDRHGTVAPGSEYRKICEDIAEAMRELVDAQSGRKVTRQVTLTHDEFQGPFVDGLPDITVLWDQSFAWHQVSSPAIGRLTLRRQDSRTGSHTPHGFLLARGYGESPGTELPRATLYDIAPTVLSAAEIETPSHMDGRPLFARSSVASSA